MRTRRDHARFLNLIEVSAFLHQYQRERARLSSRSGDAIVASVEDYEVAYALAASVLAETLSDVRKPLREAYERIRELSLKGDGTVSRREIREALAASRFDREALARPTWSSSSTWPCPRPGPKAPGGPDGGIGWWNASGRSKARPFEPVGAPCRAREKPPPAKNRQTAVAVFLEAGQ